MFESFKLILTENWKWRKQIFNLSIMDIIKTCRGAVLGWIWLLIKPLTYIFVFWFALELGLKASSTVGDYPYILWLVSGLIPWFFMQDMINTGGNVYHRYPYLVNRIHFPLSVISTFYSLSQFIINLSLIILLVTMCWLSGYKLSLYALQLPFVLLAMWLFFTLFSIMVSPLSAISKDFSNLLKAFSTPLFWISGIIFNISSLGIKPLETLLAFNPVTFFVTGIRASLCDQYWIWERSEIFIPFIIVSLTTLVAACFVYDRLRKDVPDVL